MLFSHGAQCELQAALYMLNGALQCRVLALVKRSMNYTGYLWDYVLHALFLSLKWIYRVADCDDILSAPLCSGHPVICCIEIVFWKVQPRRPLYRLLWPTLDWNQALLFVFWCYLKRCVLPLLHRESWTHKMSDILWGFVGRRDFIIEMNLLMLVMIYKDTAGQLEFDPDWFLIFLKNVFY